MMNYTSNRFWIVCFYAVLSQVLCINCRRSSCHSINYTDDYVHDYAQVLAEDCISSDLIIYQKSRLFLTLKIFSRYTNYKNLKQILIEIYEIIFISIRSVLFIKCIDNQEANLFVVPSFYIASCCLDKRKKKI